MLNQKIHLDLFNFPSKQGVSVHNNVNFLFFFFPYFLIIFKSSKPQGFYLPCANLKKSPEKLSANQRRNSRSKKIDLSTQNQSKYECSRQDELKTNNNSIYFNEKNILHNIKYKRSLEHSKNENDDSLNFTYFSKEIGILNEKKPPGYHILKGFLSK